MLSREELTRYHRHLILKDFGRPAQDKLKSSRVLVIGAGGLGCPCLLYLTAAGVGRIGIVDFDTVDVSNLQRQILFTIADLGKNKSEAAAEHLRLLNPWVEFDLYPIQITSENAEKIISNYDVVVDGSDNFPTRYLVNDACVFQNKPLVYGSIFRFEGQASVFNYETTFGRGPNYRDLFPTPPVPGTVPSCSEAGVLGVLPGVIGSLQANEAIKIITGTGSPLSGKLYLWDALTMESRVLNFEGDDENPLTGKNPTIKTLIDYEKFCGLNTSEHTMKEISPKALKTLLDEKADIQIIDVRESTEYEICNLGGELIPLGLIKLRLEKISKIKPVVIYCKMGGRSAQAIKILESHGFDNLMNLRGGLLAYIDEVDPKLTKY